MRLCASRPRPSRWLLWIAAPALLAAPAHAAPPVGNLPAPPTALPKADKPAATARTPTAAPRRAIITPFPNVAWVGVPEIASQCASKQTDLAMKRLKSAFASCYNNALRRDMNTEGTFRFGAIVGPYGYAKGAKVHPLKGGEFTPIASTPSLLTRCLQGRVKALRLMPVANRKRCVIKGNFSLTRAPSARSKAALPKCTIAHLAYVSDFFREELFSCALQGPGTDMVGQATLSMRYKPDGSTSRVKVTADYRPRKAMRCFKNVAKRFRFKARPGGQACNVSFDLNVSAKRIVPTIVGGL